MKLSFEFADPITGKSNLCPIIFLHGIFGSKKAWRSVAPEICSSTRRRVYCVDARNHGNSGMSVNFTIRQMTEDIRRFINKLGITRAILVGSNMGGSVAMKLALESPELIEKLIVESMMPEPYAPHGWQILIDVIPKLKTALGQIRENANKSVIQGDDSSYFTLELGLLRIPLKEENGILSWDANLDVIEVALHTYDFDDGLSGTYDGETLFLYAAGMKGIPTNERIRQLFPKSILIAVEEVLCMPHLERPMTFIEEVVQFINGPCLDTNFGST